MNGKYRVANDRSDWHITKYIDEIVVYCGISILYHAIVIKPITTINEQFPIQSYWCDI